MSAERPIDPRHYTQEYFLNSCGGSEFFKRYGPKILKPTMAYAFLRAGVRPGMRILDVGCGRGEILFHARQAGAEGIGTDCAEPALKIASQVSGCPTFLADAKNLPFPLASFDRIFFLGVMDHLLDWELEACFMEFARLLRPQGCVLVHTCANRLYYKNWSYGFRRSTARGLRAMGLRVRDPAPPRSEEDQTLHINEHTYGSMRSFFRRIGWKAQIDSRPNYKLVLNELYGDPLPPDFPLKPSPWFQSRIFFALFWRGPLKRIFAREFFCVVYPP